MVQMVIKTNADLVAACRALDVSCKWIADTREYRVTPKWVANDKREDCAAYETDRVAAYQTALAMHRWALLHRQK